MNAVLWIFIAIAFGLLLFTSLQDKLPDELSFLKSSTGSVEALGSTDPGAARASFVHQGWRVRQEGPTIEFIKAFSGELEANGRSYDAPEIGILCHEGKLDTRIDTRAATTGTTSTPVTVTVGGLGRQMWAKGSGMNIFPPGAKEFVAAASKSLQPVEFTISYVELGNQKTKLDTTGLAALLAQLPAGCKN